MTLDVKHFVLSHAMWIAIAAVGIFAGHAWLVEHDNRLLAERQGEITAVQLKASAERERGLIQQVAEVKDQAATDKKALLAAVAKVKTAEQAKPVIENLAPELHPAVVPNTQSVTVDAVPLATVLTQCRVDQVELGACKAEVVLKDKIVAEKEVQIKAQNDEIKELKKPQGFWKRVTGHGKAAVAGILIFEGVKIWLSGKP